LTNAAYQLSLYICWAEQKRLASFCPIVAAGFVAEYSAQPFNRDGWGGVPLDVTATIEKDKTTTCLQAEANASIIHSVAPFGSRHVTQVGVYDMFGCHFRKEPASVAGHV
jgi:hypothetical protein